jgi:hypothetical protein
MANWTLPTLTDLYGNFLSFLKGRDDDLARGLDPARVTVTNQPQWSIRWSSASNKWELFNGSAWVDLAATYAINISGNAATSTKWAATKTIAISGDGVGTATAIDGSANISIPFTLSTVAVNKGGTGFASYTIGDLLFANSASTLAKLAGVATGNVLRSGGIGSAPSWGKVDLATHMSGTLPVANGGTGVTGLTGLAKGNGVGAFSAAVAGTDFQAPITGAASTVTGSNLTASRAVVSDASGKIAAATATSVEIGHLSGVTSAIQTQINSKVAKTGDTMTGPLVLPANASAALEAVPKQQLDSEVSALTTSVNNATHASPLIWNTGTSMRSARGMADHTDFNTLTSSGVYNFDCTSSPNKPSDAWSWIFVEVYTHSNTGNIHCVQIAHDMNMSSTTTTSWIRKFVNGSGWSSWSYFGEPDSLTLSTTVNLNTVITPGEYTGVLTNVVNRPTQIATGRYYLQVRRTGTNVHQTLYGVENSVNYNATVFTRYSTNSGSTWALWKTTRSPDFAWSSSAVPSSGFHNWGVYGAGYYINEIIIGLDAVSTTSTGVIRLEMYNWNGLPIITSARGGVHTGAAGAQWASGTAVHLLHSSAAADHWGGVINLTRLDGVNWYLSSQIAKTNGAGLHSAAGVIQLSDDIETISLRLTAGNFDVSGRVSIAIR